MISAAAYLINISYILTSFIAISTNSLNEWEYLRLPDEHIPFYFNNNPAIKDACEKDVKCPYKHQLEISAERCWGYEADCPEKHRLGNPECPEKVSWFKSKEEQLKKFWTDGDFGYVKARKDQLTTYCEPIEENDSSLQCSDQTTFCTAKNLYLDLTKADFDSSRNRYREDMIEPGQIGGRCKLNKEALEKQGTAKSPLQSWYAELQHYTSLDFHPVMDNRCDVTFEKPTVLIKLDAGVNMYHHFCDYVNLYASQHINNSFNMDIQIIMWDTVSLKIFSLCK